MKWIDINGKSYNPENCYYLDTNVLAIVMLNKEDEIRRDVKKILDNAQNAFFITPIVLREFLSLYKAMNVKHKIYRTIDDIYDAIKAIKMIIVPYTEKAVKVESEMYFKEGHKCPFDYMILSQSIADNIALISTDHDFDFYREQGLKLVFNKR